MKTNNPEINVRLRKAVLKYTIILGIALAYLAFVLLTGIGIPCVFHEITGLKCPGCGISRMFISLAKLDFVSAFKYNSFIFLTGPFILAYFVFSEVKYVISGSKQMGKWEIFLWIELVLALAFAVLRNIFPI